jgi:hypothetical protein
MKTARSIVHLALLISIIAVILVSGCGTNNPTKRFHTVRIQTGLFNDNPDELLKKFNQIKEKETTRRQLRKMGFDEDAKNVVIDQGVEGLKKIYGPNYFDGTGRDKTDTKKDLSEHTRYVLISIPYKDLLIKSDRIYLNKKKTETKGLDMVLSIVLYDDVVIYRAPRKVYRDETEVDRAFLQGLVDLFDTGQNAVRHVR